MSADDTTTKSLPAVSQEAADEFAAILAHSPPWLALLLRELKDTRTQVQERELAAIERELAEQKRADVRHDDANRLSSAFLNVEKKLELLRQQIVGCREDFARATSRIDLHDVRLDDHQQRLEALEHRTGLVVNMSTPPSEPPGKKA